MEEKFFNPISGEMLIHRERDDGTRDLIIENPSVGATGCDHFHAVLEKNGNVEYLREMFGNLIADKKRD